MSNANDFTQLAHRIERAGSQLKSGRLEDAVPFLRYFFTSLQVPPPSSDQTQSLVVLHIVRILSHISSSPSRIHEDLSRNLRDLWPKIWPWISYLADPVRPRTGPIDAKFVMGSISAAICAFLGHAGFRNDMLNTPGLLSMIVDNWVKKTPPFEGLFCAILADDSTTGDCARKYLPPILDGKIAQVARGAMDHLHRSIAHEPTNFNAIKVDLGNVRSLLDLRIPDVFDALFRHDFIPLTIDALSLFRPSRMVRSGTAECLVGCLDLFRSILFSEHAVEWLGEALPQNLLRSIMRLGPCITSLPEGQLLVRDILIFISGCSVYLSVVELLELFIVEVHENETDIMRIESLRSPLQMLKLMTRELSKYFNDYTEGTLSRKFVKEGCIACTGLDAKWQCSGCCKEYCYVKYCSRKCQKRDWPKHRIVCRSRLNLEKSGARPPALSRSDRGFIWYIAQMDFLENLTNLVSHIQDQDPYACLRPVRIGFDYDTDRAVNILESHEHCIRCQDEPHFIILQVRIFGGSQPSFIHGSFPLPECFQRRQPARGLASAKFLCARHRDINPHHV